MIINALRFRFEPQSEYLIWRFQAGHGKYSNFQLFNGPAPLINDVSKAINYALTGETNDRIFDVAMQFSDDAGDTWMIERGPSKLRYLRNGKEIGSEHVAESLLAALLDTDLLGDTNAPERKDTKNSVVKTIQLETSEAGIHIRTNDQASMWRARCLEFARAGKQNVVAEIETLLQDPSFKNESMTIELSKALGPIFYSYREALRQRRTLIANKDALEHINPQLIERLTSEVELISEIKTIADPLLDPANAPKITADKLKKIEEELKEGMAVCNIQTVPVPISDDMIPWGKLSTCLANLEAHERLIASLEQINRVNNERIAPIQEQHIKTLTKLLDADSQITTELESCLTTLSLNLTQSEAQKKPSKSLTGLVSKFIKPAEAHSTLHLSESEIAANQAASLETSRMAVDYALGKLGELHSNLSEAEKSSNDWHLEISGLLEKYVHEYGKLKKMWETYSKQFSLPASMNLKDLTALICRYNLLNDLWQKRHFYRKAMTERKQSLILLEQKVREWQHACGSQKEQNLNNQAILVAEAQAATRYLDKKRQQLNKLQQSVEQFRSLQLIKSNIEARLNHVRAKWSEVFAKHGVAEVAPTDGRWPAFFALAQKLETWGSLVSEETKPPQVAELFTAATTGMPLQIYLCRDANLGHGIAQAFVQTLENHSAQGLQLIMVADDSLAHMLASRGVGKSVKLTPKSSGGAKPAVTPGAALATREAAATRTAQTTNPTNNDMNSSLAERAEAVINLLNPNRSKPTL